MWERITPPKIVPRAFVSLGRSRTLMAGIRSSAIQASITSPAGTALAAGGCSAARDRLARRGDPLRAALRARVRAGRRVPVRAGRIQAQEGPGAPEPPPGGRHARL